MDSNLNGKIQNHLNDLIGSNEEKENGKISNFDSKQQNPKRRKSHSKHNEQGEYEYDYYYSDDEENDENKQKNENVIQQNNEGNVGENANYNSLNDKNAIDNSRNDKDYIQNQSNPKQFDDNSQNESEENENVNENRLAEGTQTPKRKNSPPPGYTTINDENNDDVTNSAQQDNAENKELTQTNDETNNKEKQVPDNRTPEEKELDDAIQRCFDTFKAPPPEMREQIKQRLNARRVDAIIASKYDEAEEIDKYEKAFNYSLQLEADKHKEDNRIDILYGRYQNLQERLQKEEEYWAQQEKEFLEQNDKFLEDLQEKHKKELEEFSEKWRDPNYLRQFNKPSSKLLQLREMEKARAISRLYQQAKDIKIVADKLQQEETQRAQAKIARQMQIDKQKLLERQKNDLVRNEQHKKKVLLDMKKEKEKVTRPIHAAISQMRAKKDTIPLTTKPRSAAFSAPQESVSPISPRTHEKYISFRTEKRKTRLDVHPVDEKSLKTPKTRATTSKSTIRRPITSQRNKFGVRK